LVEAGANVQERSGAAGLTLLHLVRSVEMAELLLNAGIPVDANDHYGRTPLDLAVEEGRLGIARLMVSRGAGPNFFAWVALGNHDRAASMRDRDSELIFKVNEPSGLPPVDPNRAEKLERGELIEWPYGSSCGTALHYAVKSGSLAMVQWLLARGANVNAATRRCGWTPLHDAVYYTICQDLRQGESIIRTLVAAGANLTAETVGGTTLEALRIILAQVRGFSRSAKDLRSISGVYCHHDGSKTLAVRRNL
jgi:ankyrin repeat protein